MLRRDVDSTIATLAEQRLDLIAAGDHAARSDTEL